MRGPPVRSRAYLGQPFPRLLEDPRCLKLLASDASGFLGTETHCPSPLLLPEPTIICPPFRTVSSRSVGSPRLRRICECLSARSVLASWSLFSKFLARQLSLALWGDPSSVAELLGSQIRGRQASETIIDLTRARPHRKRNHSRPQLQVRYRTAQEIVACTSVELCPRHVILVIERPSLSFVLSRSTPRAAKSSLASSPSPHRVSCVVVSLKGAGM